MKKKTQDGVNVVFLRCVNDPSPISGKLFRYIFNHFFRIKFGRRHFCSLNVLLID